MKRISGDDRAGIYLTAIVHLAVLIVLLASGLGYSLSGENSFVLDFSHQDEIERMEAEIERLRAEAEFREAISRKLQEELGGDVPVSQQSPSSDIRNIAVDRGALRDDRGTDAQQLYADAERLRQELLRGSDILDEDYAAPAPENPSKAEETEHEAKTESYSGPSVVAYELAGRKASRLSIPAYRCLGGGEVKVLITVSPAGKVIDARIDESVSSTDRCLRDFAIRAAKASQFSARQGAAPKQSGYIVYQFIAQ